MDILAHITDLSDIPTLAEPQLIPVVPPASLVQVTRFNQAASSDVNGKLQRFLLRKDIGTQMVHYLLTIRMQVMDQEQ